MPFLQAEPRASGLVGPRVGAADDDEARSALRTLREMVRTARGLGLSASDEDVLEQAASIACELVGYASCAIALHDDDGNFRYHAYFVAGAGNKRPPAELVLTGAAYEALCQAATVVEGAFWLPPDHPVRSRPAVDGGLASAHTIAGTGWGAGPLLWAPLIADDGSHLGFVNPDDLACSEPPDPFEALLLGTLAEVAALGLELRRVDAAKRRSAAVAEAQRRQLEGLIAASLEVRGEAALDDALADIARAMATAVGFRRAAIYLLEAGADRPPVQASAGLDRAQDAALEQVPMALVTTVGLEVAEADRLKRSCTSLSVFAPLMRPEMRLSRCFLFDHRYFELPPGWDDKMSASQEPTDWVEGLWHPDDSLSVPLEDRQGNLLGLISMDEPLNQALPSREDCRALEFFADQCALAVVESSRLEAALEEATTDDLTGLANRRAFLERAPGIVQSARRNVSTCSALYVDIDHFKDINDSFGHATGDEVIVAVGRAIANRLRRGDLVARYGGEEFVALLPDTALDEATALAEEIRRLVAATDMVAVNPPLEVRVSVGVAGLRLGDDTQALLAAADAALYQAKRSGRNRVCVAPA